MVKYVFFWKWRMAKLIFFWLFSLRDTITRLLNGKIWGILLFQDTRHSRTRFILLSGSEYTSEFGILSVDLESWKPWLEFHNSIIVRIKKFSTEQVSKELLDKFHKRLLRDRFNSKSACVHVCQTRENLKLPYLIRTSSQTRHRASIGVSYTKCERTYRCDPTHVRIWMSRWFWNWIKKVTMWQGIHFCGNI